MFVQLSLLKMQRQLFIFGCKLPKIGKETENS